VQVFHALAAQILSRQASAASFPAHFSSERHRARITASLI